MQLAPMFLKVFDADLSRMWRPILHNYSQVRPGISREYTDNPVHTVVWATKNYKFLRGPHLRAIEPNDFGLPPPGCVRAGLLRPSLERKS